MPFIDMRYNMILATNNKGKIKEIRDIFNNYDIKSLDEANVKIEVDEDQDSFYGNALKKATEVYKLVNEPTIADDSGLCIDCLDNFPGVQTARFLGDNSSVNERNNCIIEKMKDFSGDARKAHVLCNLVYYDGLNIVVGEGILYGKISCARRGENGFGFDDIFELEDGRTLAELTKEDKNNVSARYLAILDLKEKLQMLKNQDCPIKLKNN